MDKITVGILTVSDRCKNKEATDESGPNLSQMIENGVVKNGVVVKVDLVPDCVEDIKKVLVKWCEDEIDLILTTGGTGLGQRDVTPEATLKVMDKVAPGINHLMLKRSLEVTTLAALSRAVAGARENSLIINLPGSKKASQECLEAVAEVIPHAVDLIKGRGKQVDEAHQSLIAGKSSLVVKGPAERNRKSPYPLITVKEALEIILNRICILRKEKTVKYEEALGHVLAQEVIATDSLPPFDVSLKDGYAIGDCYVNEALQVLKSGSSPFDLEMKSGHCMRISTGMAVPPGTYAVIQVEDTDVSSIDENGEEKTVKIRKNVMRGTDVRPKGSDYVSGELLLRYGTYLDPPAVGLLAAAGRLSVRVLEKPVVAVFSTGDELATVEGPKETWKVRDSNRVFLLSLLNEKGFLGLDLGIARDNPDALRDSLERGFRAADVVVTSGSMSMGERDFLKDVLVADFNAEIHFGRVRMKPGKPTSLATLNFGGKPKVWFGLPGNPASTFATSHLFLLPALRKAAGWKEVSPMTVEATIEEKIQRDPDRVHYARGTLSYFLRSKTWKAELMKSQASSSIRNCVNANCLIRIPPISYPPTPDSPVQALLIGKIAFRN